MRSGGFTLEALVVAVILFFAASSLTQTTNEWHKLNIISGSGQKISDHLFFDVTGNPPFKSETVCKARITIKHEGKTVSAVDDSAFYCAPPVKDRPAQIKLNVYDLQRHLKDGGVKITPEGIVEAIEVSKTIEVKP